MDADADNVYSVMVVASDGTNDGAMGVTVTVTDVDENVAPEFAEDTTTREVEENTPQGENIGGPVAAVAGDDDMLTYRHRRRRREFLHHHPYNGSDQGQGRPGLRDEEQLHRHRYGHRRERP